MRGFTLMELVVAVGLAGIVSAAAVTATVAIYRSTNALEQQAEADIEAKLLVDHLTSETLQVGGGAVRPWQAISASCTDGTSMPSCGSNGTDRLHLITVDDSINSATVSVWDGTSSLLTVLAPGGVCPLTGFGGARDIVIVPNVSAGGGWKVKRCTPNALLCTCALADIVNATNVGPSAGVSVTAASWPGGTIAVARQTSFYLDRTAHKLYQRTDINGDNAQDSVLMSDRVYDFQVQFGYDNSPVDGVLDSTWQTSVDPAMAPDIRMTRIGIVVGTPTPGRDIPSSAQLFGGEKFSSTKGKLFRAAAGSVALRNVLVFF